jgi:hypothetical protein
MNCWPNRLLTPSQVAGLFRAMPDRIMGMNGPSPLMLAGQWVVVVVYGYIITAPLWLPWLFVAFAIGRRRFGIAAVLWLIGLEVVLIPLSLIVINTPIRIISF